MSNVRPVGDILLCLLVLGCILAFLRFAWLTLRYGNDIYDHLPDVNKLVARTSITAALAFARLNQEGQRLRAGFFRSIAGCFASVMLAIVFSLLLRLRGSSFP